MAENASTGLGGKQAGIAIGEFKRCPLATQKGGRTEILTLCHFGTLSNKDDISRSLTLLSPSKEETNTSLLMNDMLSAAGLRSESSGRMFLK